MDRMDVPTLTRSQVRRVDELAINIYGMNSLVLMENAARGCVDHLPGSGPVVICCGKGNNAGDGFAMARHIDNSNRPCEVFLFGNESDLSGDAKQNWDLLRWTDVATHVVPAGPNADFRASATNAEWLIDALLGTGAIGSVRKPFADVVELINASGVSVGAVDLPTGLDADTGKIAGPCIRADRTWTFIAEKPGLRSGDGDSHSGQVFTIDIGVPRRIIREAANL